MRFLEVSEDCGVMKQGTLIYDSQRLLKGKGKIEGCIHIASRTLKSCWQVALAFSPYEKLQRTATE